MSGLRCNSEVVTKAGTTELGGQRFRCDRRVPQVDSRTSIGLDASASAQGRA